MKRSTLWILSGVAAAVVLAGGARWASQRQPATDAAKTTAPVANLIELSASDVVPVQKMDMVQGLAVSGTLKASQSAMVKARVVGELLDLVVREGDGLPGQGWWTGRTDYQGEWTGPQAQAHIRQLQDGI